MREILVDWTTPSGGGKVSVLYFDEVGILAAQRSALGTFLGAVDAICANLTTWTIRTVGRTINPVTGGLTGEWTESTAHTGTGGAAGQSVADASQALVRWGTGQVVEGRFLKGRTYIPGVSVLNLAGGNLSTSAQGTINTAANAFITSGDGMQVWHRPQPDSAGVSHPVTSGSAWSEMAVLRQRR